MTDTDERLQCAIPGCHQEAHPPALGIEEGVCTHHLSLAKAHLRDRVAQTSRRFARIDALWSNDAAYDKIIASDRYFKLSNATCWAQENLEAAWARAKLSILVAEGKDERSDSIANPGLRASA